MYVGYVPAAVKSIATIQSMIKANKEVFKALPVCGGWAPVWSLLVAIDEAIQEHLADSNDEEIRMRLLRLTEVSVNMPVRLRTSPTATQIKLDQMGAQDELRILRCGFGAVSFIRFGVSVLSFPDISGKESGPALVTKLETLGVTWHGNKVTENMAYAIKALVGMADTGDGLAAVQFLERVDDSVLEDFTKVQRVLQTIRKTCAAHEWMDSIARQVCLVCGVAKLARHHGGVPCAAHITLP